MADSGTMALANIITRGNNWTGQAGVALANSVVETIITPTNPDFGFNTTYPQLFLSQVIRVTAWGVYSTTGTPTLRLRLCFGGTVAGGGVALIDTTAITTISGAANTHWKLSAEIACRATGSSGSVIAEGMALGLTTATSVALLPATAPAATTIDTTASKSLVLSALWGTANASNTVQVTQFIIESLPGLS